MPMPMPMQPTERDRERFRDACKYHLTYCEFDREGVDGDYKCSVTRDLFKIWWSVERERQLLQNLNQSQAIDSGCILKGGIMTEERNALHEERDAAYAHWKKKWNSMSPADKEDAGMPTQIEIWNASWESAMDLAARCLQLVDAGYKSGPLQ